MQDGGLGLLQKGAERRSTAAVARDHEQRMDQACRETDRSRRLGACRG